MQGLVAVPCRRGQLVQALQASGVWARVTGVRAVAGVQVRWWKGEGALEKVHGAGLGSGPFDVSAFVLEAVAAVHDGDVQVALHVAVCASVCTCNTAGILFFADQTAACHEPLTVRGAVCSRVQQAIQQIFHLRERELGFMRAGAKEASCR